LPVPRPALELIVSWLDANRPTPSEVTLVHGDFRLGNFMVAKDGLTGVLDWEFARWGSPFEDVAWLCLRDWRFGQLKNAAGGFCARSVWYEAYARASGRKVDPNIVRYWEIMGNVRWALGAFMQGLRYLSGSEADFELIAIGRRAQEMEFEALRLIEET
jgi:aminoglycoside phosphotransferase (APT) family kinase protein